MSDCWLWAGYIDKGGYGRLGSKLAHRVVYESMVGGIPIGLELDHLCRTPPCINPDHLEPVTTAVNAERRRRAACRHGHPYSQDNTLTYVYGGRVNRRCRACANEASKRSYYKCAKI